MRRVIYALIAIVALAAFLHQGGAASAHELDEVAATPQAVIVTMQYGAALHRAPSSDAAVAVVASCGEVLSVVGAQDGWYRVYSRAGYYWVGGARVADADLTAAPDCSNAVTYQVDDFVLTSVPSGCLSQRDAPSRNATFSQCVGNGTVYQIKSGPVLSEGEDWFRVSSNDYGDGWMLAKYLLFAA